MSMVFCRGCGKEIHETAVTCPSCGAPQGIPTAPESGNWYQKILSSYSKSPYSKYIKGFFTFLIVAVMIASVFKGNYGTELKFNGGQLFYTSAVTKDEAEKLGNYLIKEGVFDGNKKTVQLNKSNNTYEVRMVVKKGIDQDTDIIDAIKELNEAISKDVFNSSPVETHLCDEKLKTIRVIVSL